MSKWEQTDGPIPRLRRALPPNNRKLFSPARAMRRMRENIASSRDIGMNRLLCYNE